jgi:hypothetical protein
VGQVTRQKVKPGEELRERTITLAPGDKLKDVWFDEKSMRSLMALPSCVMEGLTINRDGDGYLVSGVIGHPQ